MKTIKINPTQVKIVPTKKKFENAQKIAQNTLSENSQIIGESGLPKEMPIEKKFFITSAQDVFESVKDSIQLSIERMRG